jgi:predicted component of type VI protein secretion system
MTTQLVQLVLLGLGKKLHVDIDLTIARQIVFYLCFTCIGQKLHVDIDLTIALQIVFICVLLGLGKNLC